MHNKMRRRRSVMGGPVACAMERLDARVFLSLSAGGGEIPVNTATAGDQRTSAIATESNGDFVVTWSSSTGDGSGSAIFARRYNSNGSALGSQFLVNTTTLNSQGSPAIAMDSDGDFVIAWTDSGSGYGEIRGQRFNSAGVVQGTEFKVNTYTTGEQVSPAVAMDAAGDFVVAWTSYGQDGSYYGVYAQRYNSAGAAQGVEFKINNLTANSQSNAKVAMSATGDFVVAWTGYTAGGGGYDTYARRYSAAGVAQGGDVRVNSFTPNSQGSPAVAMDASGDYVVAWDSTNQDGHLSGVFAQRYSAQGVPQGVEFKVNTYTTSAQRVPSAAMDADGDFVVTWMSLQDGGSYGIYAQAYNAVGVPQGAEFKVNTYTISNQLSPAVAMAAEGEVVVAWESAQDGSGYGIYAQRYITLPTVEAVSINGRSVLPYEVHESLSQIVVRFSENVSDSGGTTGVNSVTNPANWLITRNGADITGNVSITYGFNPAVNRFEAVLTLSQTFTNGNFLLKAKDNIRDVNGNPLDGNNDSVPGGSFLLPFSLQAMGARDGEFNVNLPFPSEIQTLPAVASNASGAYVAVWQTFGQDFISYGIYAQRYNRAGVPQGGEFRVNTVYTGAQTAPDVAMDAAGNFVVTWDSSTQEGDPGVYAQRYNSAGVAQGTEFRVNQVTNSSQFESSIAMGPTGNFVVAWTSSIQDGNGLGIYATVFDSAGIRQVNEFRVNTFTTGNQYKPSVAVDGTGSYVVAWQSHLQDGNGLGIFARRYNSSNVPQSSEFKVNSYTNGDQSEPAVATDGDGDFVVAWQSNLQDGDGMGVYAQRYDAAGAAQSGEFRVNSHTTNTQEEVSASMDSAGNFVIAWQSNLQDQSETGVYAKRFTAAGAAQSEFKVNTTTSGIQQDSDVAMDGNGNFMVVWRGAGNFDGNGIFAQRYAFRNTPTVATLTDTPDPVFSGNSFTLSAGGTSADGGPVTSVSFFRESNGDPGLQIGVFGDTPVGTDTTLSGGFWSISVSTALLSAGTYTYWAQAGDEAGDGNGLIGTPASTANTVDPPPGPVVLSSEFGYQTSPHTLKFTFDRDVSTTFGSNDVTLERIGGGSVPAFSMFTPGPAGTNSYTLTMQSLFLNGNYRATINASGVTDGGNPMAANYVFDFFIQAGDANHDRKVDVLDLIVLSNNWLGSGKNYSQSDFNYDGLVNQTDLGIMAQHWQQNLAAAAPSLPAVPTAVRTPVRAPTRTPTRVIDLVQ